MLFDPEKYSIADCPRVPFIDLEEIKALIDNGREPDISEVRGVIAKSMSGRRLSMKDTAVLIMASSPEAAAEILSAAREVKLKTYGNRIVLFAPLYVGNKCVNNCLYCGFRIGNKQAQRATLTSGGLISEVENLERAGHKRLIMVYGEHPSYDAGFIASTVRQAYGVKTGRGGEIRRINVNAAPLDTEGFRTVKDAGIGTYQIFQETYDRDVYRRFHAAGPKSDYDYRLTALDRAMDAGIDDVGLGVLVGLGDWRFETLGLIRHTNHLEVCYGVGPHTISFPRIKNASAQEKSMLTDVSDDDFIRMVAILRLAVPYAGLILTARELPELRDRLIEYGISQIDAGTRLEIGGYSSAETGQDIHREQFELGDERSLSCMVSSLVGSGQMPSFCTACYRKGRTGEHFMEFSTKGFIKRFCTPNAILTFAEYLEDYATGEEKQKGWALIERELGRLESAGSSGSEGPLESSGSSGSEVSRREDIGLRLDQIKKGRRDLLY